MSVLQKSAEQQQSRSFAISKVDDEFVYIEIVGIDRKYRLVYNVFADRNLVLVEIPDSYHSELGSASRYATLKTKLRVFFPGKLIDTRTQAPLEFRRAQEANKKEAEVPVKGKSPKKKIS